MKQSGLSPKFKVTGMGTDSVLVYKKVVTGVCQTITVQILLLNFIYNGPVPVLKKKKRELQAQYSFTYQIQYIGK